MSARSLSTGLGLAIHEQIRANILTGRHPAGSPLRVAPLAERYDASSAVIREALVRLVEQHLATLLPNQGFRVVAASRSDLIDLTEVRVLTEGAAIRRSVTEGDVAWESRVIRAHHVLDRTRLSRDREPGTTEEWSRIHDEFHESLVSACGSARLLAATRGFRGSAEVYRQLSGSARDTHRRDLATEHRELMQLAINRRADAAGAALARHIGRTTDLLLETLTDEEP